MIKSWITQFKHCRALLLGSILLTALLASPVQAIDTNDWTLLYQGKVVVKQLASTESAMPAVEAKILISKPSEKVWTIVSNPEKLMQEEQKVKRVKILSQQGNKQQVAFSVFMTRLLPTFNYILEQELFAPNLVRFHRVSGSFKDIQGFWKLTPIENGNKTILTYNLKLDPGPLIPRSMLLGAIKADLPNMLQSVKQAIDQNL